MTLLVWPPTSTTVTGSATETTQLNVLTAVQQLHTDNASILAGQKPEYSAAFAPVSGAAIALTANVWAQLVASTSAKAIRISYFQDSGYAIELGFGTASKVVLADSGEEDLLIPAGTQLQLRCTTSVTLGTFWMSFLV